MWKSIEKILSALGLSGAGNGAGGPGGEQPSDLDGESDGAPTGDPDVEMLTCPEALERLFEYLDEELDPTVHRQVEVHMEICKRCYPRLEFERAFMETLRRTRAGEKTPADLRQRVVEVLAREGLETA